MVTDKEQLIQWFKDHHIALLYFYRPDCEYCMMTDPYVRAIEDAGIKVYRINVYDHYNAAMKWHVMGTPTTVAVDPEDHIAVPYQGAFGNLEPVLYYFYSVIQRRLQNKDSGL